MEPMSNRKKSKIADAAADSVKFLFDLKSFYFLYSPLVYLFCFFFFFAYHPGHALIALQF